MNLNYRIIIKDYDVLTDSVILHDNRHELSDIIVPVISIKNWRYDNPSYAKTRLKNYMKYVKAQGGKITIFDQLEEFKNKYSLV